LRSLAASADVVPRTPALETPDGRDPFHPGADWRRFAPLAGGYAVWSNDREQE